MCPALYDKRKASTCVVHVDDQVWMVAVGDKRKASTRKVSNSVAQVGDQGKAPTSAVPIGDQGEISTSEVSVGGQGKVYIRMVDVGGERKFCTSSVPVGDQGKASGNVAPVGAQGEVSTSVMPVGDQGKFYMRMGAVGEERKICTSLVPDGDQIKVSTSVAPVGDQGKVPTSEACIGDEAGVLNGFLSSQAQNKQEKSGTSEMRKSRPQTSASNLLRKFSQISASEQIVVDSIDTSTRISTAANQRRAETPSESNRPGEEGGGGVEIKFEGRTLPLRVDPDETRAALLSLLNDSAQKVGSSIPKPVFESSLNQMRLSINVSKHIFATTKLSEVKCTWLAKPCVAIRGNKTTLFCLPLLPSSSNGIVTLSVPSVRHRGKVSTVVASDGNQGKTSTSVAPIGDQGKASSSEAPVDSQGKVPIAVQHLGDQVNVSTSVAAVIDIGKSFNQVATYSKVSRPSDTNNRGTSAVTEAFLERRSASNLTVTFIDIQPGTADMLSAASSVQADGMDHNVASDVDDSGCTRQKVIGSENSTNKGEDKTRLVVFTKNGEKFLRIPLPENCIYTCTPSVIQKECNQVVFSVIIVPKDGGKYYSSKMKDSILIKIGQRQVHSVQKTINVSGHLTYTLYTVS